MMIQSFGILFLFSQAFLFLTLRSVLYPVNALFFFPVQLFSLFLSLFSSLVNGCYFMWDVRAGKKPIECSVYIKKPLFSWLQKKTVFILVSESFCVSTFWLNVTDSDRKKNNIFVSVFLQRTVFTVLCWKAARWFLTPGTSCLTRCCRSCPDRKPDTKSPCCSRQDSGCELQSGAARLSSSLLTRNCHLVHWVQL